MEDMINEFRNLMNEAPGIGNRGSKTFLEEIGKRVKKQGGKLVDTDIQLPHLIVTSAKPKKETYVSYKPVKTTSPLGQTYTLSQPIKMEKTTLEPMLYIVMVMPYNNGYVIQTEERYGDLKKPTNLSSFPIPKDYNEKDLKKVTDKVLNAVKAFNK